MINQQLLIIYVPIKRFENTKEYFECVKVCTGLGRLDTNTIYETLRVVRKYIELENV